MAVPSFSVKFCNSLKQMQSMNFTKSLQVPGNFPLYLYRLSMPGKRVLPFASPHASCEASLTVEAALSLSLFLLMAAALIQPMVWLDRQRKVQTVTEALCGELSQYAYIEKFLKGEEEILGELEKEEEGVSRAGGIFGETAASLWLLGKIRGAAGEVHSLKIQKAQLPDEKGMIRFELEYRERIPFFSLSGRDITMTAAARRRAWIGLDGKLGRALGDQWGEEEENMIVYVGAGMGRYHWYRDCHYISNQYERVNSGQISTLRNDSGRKYKACSSCWAGGNTEGEVYITPQGEHYHKTADCRAMASYVRPVPLREVEYLGACSYCTRKRGEKE